MGPDLNTASASPSAEALQTESRATKTHVLSTSARVRARAAMVDALARVDYVRENMFVRSRQQGNALLQRSRCSHSVSLAMVCLCFGRFPSARIKRGACVRFNGHYPNYQDQVGAPLRRFIRLHSRVEASLFVFYQILCEASALCILQRCAVAVLRTSMNPSSRIALLALLVAALALAAPPSALASRVIDDAALLQRIKSAPLPPNFPDAY